MSLERSRSGRVERQKGKGRQKGRERDGRTRGRAKTRIEKQDKVKEQT